MKWAVLTLLRVYKRIISPMLRPSCRFVPSCSEYAADAVEHYGVLRGGGKAMLRLLRCHPLASGGFDPAIKHNPAAHVLNGR
jgi:putative membrane protein insertion efficiency factor